MSLTHLCYEIEKNVCISFVEDIVWLTIAIKLWARSAFNYVDSDKIWWESKCAISVKLIKETSQPLWMQHCSVFFFVSLLVWMVCVYVVCHEFVILIERKEVDIPSWLSFTMRNDGKQTNIMCNKICSKTRKYACNGGNHRSSSILLMYFVYGFNKTKRMNTSYQMLKRLIVHRFLVYCSLSLYIFIVCPYVYEYLTPTNNIHTIQNTHSHITSMIHTSWTKQ